MAGVNGADFLRDQARQRPHQDAIRFPAGRRHNGVDWQRCTFRHLDASSDAVAHRLIARGVSRGERTLVVVRPSIGLYELLFGLFKVGATPVFLDPGLDRRALFRCIANNGPTTLIGGGIALAASRVFPRTFRSVRRRIRAAALLAPYDKDAPPFEPIACDPDDDAAIVFTSGSTGAPKGVALTHRMFRAQVNALRSLLDLSPGAVDHQAFASFVIFDVSLGMTSVVPRMDLSRPASAAPEEILRCIETHQATVAFASPIVWHRVAAHCEQRGIGLPHVTKLLTVGAPIPLHLHARLLALLPDGANIWTPYGATEALPLAAIDSRTLLATVGPRTARGDGVCVGWPAPQAKLRIMPIHDHPVDTWEDDAELPQGSIGEIVADGPQVSPSYRDAPGANAASKVRRNGRVLHRMGDLGRFDDEGRLWFCGRKAHRVETADGLVTPVAVEGIFNEHEDVFRTAIVGVGPAGRKKVVLCVELKQGVAASEALKENILTLANGTPFEGVVCAVMFHPCFPTDARHNSKIRREDLTPWAQAQLPARHFTHA